MEIRDLIGSLKFLIALTILAIIGLGSFAISNYDTLQNQPTAIVAQSSDTADTQEVSQSAAEQLPGFALFNEWGCNTCHAINRKLVGPALANIRERRSDEWLQSFIKNSSAVIASGDDYAVALYNEYNQLQMPNHDLSDEEVTSILDYITEASK